MNSSSDSSLSTIVNDVSEERLQVKSCSNKDNEGENSSSSERRCHSESAVQEHRQNNEGNSVKTLSLNNYNGNKIGVSRSLNSYITGASKHANLQTGKTIDGSNALKNNSLEGVTVPCLENGENLSEENITVSDNERKPLSYSVMKNIGCCQLKVIVEEEETECSVNIQTSLTQSLACCDMPMKPATFDAKGIAIQKEIGSQSLMAYSKNAGDMSNEKDYKDYRKVIAANTSSAMSGVAQLDQNKRNFRVEKPSQNDATIGNVAENEFSQSTTFTDYPLKCQYRMLHENQEDRRHVGYCQANRHIKKQQNTKTLIDQEILEQMDGPSLHDKNAVLMKDEDTATHFPVTSDEEIRDHSSKIFALYDVEKQCLKCSGDQNYCSELPKKASKDIVEGYEEFYHGITLNSFLQGANYHQGSSASSKTTGEKRDHYKKMRSESPSNDGVAHALTNDGRVKCPISDHLEDSIKSNNTTAQHFPNDEKINQVESSGSSKQQEHMNNAQEQSHQPQEQNHKKCTRGKPLRKAEKLFLSSHGTSVPPTKIGSQHSLLRKGNFGSDGPLSTLPKLRGKGGAQLQFLAKRTSKKCQQHLECSSTNYGRFNRTTCSDADLEKIKLEISTKYNSHKKSLVSLRDSETDHSPYSSGEETYISEILEDIESKYNFAHSYNEVKNEGASVREKYDYSSQNKYITEKVEGFEDSTNEAASRDHRGLCFKRGSQEFITSFPDIKNSVNTACNYKSRFSINYRRRSKKNKEDISPAAEIRKEDLRNKPLMEHSDPDLFGIFKEAYEKTKHCINERITDLLLPSSVNLTPNASSLNDSFNVPTPRRTVLSVLKHHLQSKLFRKAQQSKVPKPKDSKKNSPSEDISDSEFSELSLDVHSKKHSRDENTRLTEYKMFSKNATTRRQNNLERKVTIDSILEDGIEAKYLRRSDTKTSLDKDVTNEDLAQKERRQGKKMCYWKRKSRKNDNDDLFPSQMKILHPRPPRFPSYNWTYSRHMAQKIR